MAKPKKSWAEKMQSDKLPVVKPAPIDIAGMKAGQIMLVPTAKLIDAAVRAIPEGQSLSIPAFRTQLAKQHQAEVCCPITTGILLRIVAEAAFENYEAGTDLADVTPVWRVLDRDAPTMKKLSYDPEFLLELRSQEGITS
ncbi:hypothetical protein MNBD_ALPHA06-1795 [hydrothermal vent metagenome]|uniref:Uncharacterized protein n=1 Tax=hydrothermal vent metagenome TaxID=652676 RepID=A0A3B0S9A7_9ZZZZ